MSLLDDGMAALHRGAFDEAAELFRRAAGSADNDADRALAELRLAAIAVLRHDRDADLRLFREHIMRRHSPMHVVIASYYLTIAAIDRGDRDSAIRYLPVLLDTVRETGDPVWLVLAYDAAAGAESIRGNHIAAIEYGRVALDAAERCPAAERAYVLATVNHNLAYNSLAASRYDAAVPYAAAAVAFTEALGHLDLYGQALVTAAFAYLCRDDYDQALDALDRAEALIGGSYLEKYMHYVRGEVARRRGDRAEAARQFKKLEALYPGIPTLTEMLLSMNVAPFLLPE